MEVIIRELNKTYELSYGLVRHIQIAIVQSVVLYKTKL